MIVICCRRVWNDDISRRFFIFLNFWFSGLLGGAKGQKMIQMRKNSVCRAAYLENHTSYDFHLWYTCVKWQIYRHFFHFFKTLIFQVVRRVIVQKMAQNECFLCLISQEPYLIWSSFTVHMCNRILSPVFWFFFHLF